MKLRCQIITVTRSRKGQPIRSARIVTGDPVTIGRSPESTVHLPDPRLDLHHARVRGLEGERIQIEAAGTSVDLRPGARVAVGPYEVVVEGLAEDGHDISLSVELIQPLGEGVAELRGRSRTSLDATWLSKRALSWAAVLAVALVGLVLPVFWATSAESRQKASSLLPDRLAAVAWNAAWDAGPLTRGHQPIAERCEACHRAPFERVPDEACKKCHVASATPDHLAASAILQGMTLGTRCAECHRDHRGEGALVRTDSSLCVNCHGAIGSLYPRTKLPAISDFGSDHPPFALSIVSAGSGEIVRSVPRAPGAVVEASGLKFPHATHLAKKGIRTPSGVRVLECSQCHKLDPAGARFEPIRMVGNCSECHRLEFEPTATKRQVPHGKPAEILTVLREFYSTVALGDTPIDVTLENDLLRRPAVEPARVERLRARAWAEQKAQAVASDLIERRLCAQCHVVVRGAGEPPTERAPWTVQPVKLTSRWLPGAAFDHRSHQQSPCEKCHDVRASKVSSDIAIPTLATCRTCHSGAAVVAGKIPSPCETCHSFHQHAKPGVRPPVSLTASDAALAPGPGGAR